MGRKNCSSGVSSHCSGEGVGGVCTYSDTPMQSSSDSNSPLSQNSCSRLNFYLFYYLRCGWEYYTSCSELMNVVDPPPFFAVEGVSFKVTFVAFNLVVKWYLCVKSSFRFAS